MWIHAAKTFTPDLDQKITDVIGERVDREDEVWINLETGVLVVLAANGGWREAGSSAFYALHVSPNGEVRDVSYGLLGGPVHFDADTPRGVGSYAPQREKAVKHLDGVLDVQPSTFKR